MNECINCQHWTQYQDGESESQFGENVVTSLEWVSECKRGYTNVFNKSGGETDCKSYKEYRQNNPSEAAAV